MQKTDKQVIRYCKRMLHAHAHTEELYTKFLNYSINNNLTSEQLELMSDVKYEKSGPTGCGCYVDKGYPTKNN